MWAFPCPGHAHEPAVGTSLVWPDSEAAEPSVVVSNRGLVFAEEAQGETAFSLRCNEAYEVSTAERPSVFVGSSGDLLVGVYHSVFRTSDRACSLEPATGLPDESLGNTVRLGDTLKVPSRSATESAGVWVSEDFGSSWTLAHENAGGEYFDKLVPAPGDPSRVYAAGFATGTGIRQVVCGVSEDAGATWEIKPLAGEITPFAVHPSDPEVVFAYEPVDPVRFRVLRSDDACTTFEPVLENVSMPTSLAGAPDSETLWLGLATGTGGLYRSDDAGATFVRALADEINTITCLDYRQGRLWLCANLAPNTNGVWFTEDEGETLQPFMTFAGVGKPVECTDAAARTLCAGPWYDFHMELHPPGSGVDAGVADAGMADASADDAGVADAGSEADADAPRPPAGENPDGATDEPKAASGGCEVAVLSGASTGRGLWVVLVTVLCFMSRIRRRRLSA